MFVALDNTRTLYFVIGDPFSAGLTHVIVTSSKLSETVTAAICVGTEADVID